MNLLNRIVAALLWLFLLLLICYVAVMPFRALAQAQLFLDGRLAQLTGWQEENSANFVIGQIAVVVGAVALFGTLLITELWTGRRRGVRVRTVEGGSVELDTDSIGRRLEWHLDQLAEIVTVIPSVKSRGGAVDIRLEVETAPNVDVPMKTDEVVEVTRDIIEQDMGLKLGRLDVQLRYAPYDPEWS
ncbi:MAG: hypothetical protein H6642_11485 [Caldilineaceae bacterium]|nr:hypothetical protein [Caldilineaceae bacterium]MCB9138959.1 hypothetical protein [Caldilineaceae bacterium]